GASLPPLPIQYADYAAWQRQRPDDGRDLAYWKQQLAEPPTLELATDRPRAAVQSQRGGLHAVELPLELSAALRALGQREGATLAPQRALGRTPLFQVMFVLQNAPLPPLQMGDVALEPFVVDTETAKFELTLSLEETAAGLRGAIEYNRDLFDAATVARLAAHLRTLLESIVADPAQSIAQLALVA